MTHPRKRKGTSPETRRFVCLPARSSRNAAEDGSSRSSRNADDDPNTRTALTEHQDSRREPRIVVERGVAQNGEGVRGGAHQVADCGLPFVGAHATSEKFETAL